MPSNLALLAREQWELEYDLAEVEARLQSLQARHRRLMEDEVPEAVDQLDWGSLEIYVDDEGDLVHVLTDDLEIEVRGTFHPRVNKRDMPEAAAWLKAQKLASLLRTDATLSFRTGEGKAARAFLEAVKNACPDHVPEVTETIHANTLKKFALESLREGRTLPDVFQIYNRRIARVTLASPPEPPPEPPRKFKPVRDSGYDLDT